MAAPLQVRLVSPQETVFEADAVSVVAPAWDGQVGILPGHAPMIALLGRGYLGLTLVGGEREAFFLAQGIMKVEDDRVTILSELVSRAEPDEVELSGLWPDPSDLLAEGLTPGDPLIRR